jgi:ferredoxin
MNDRKNAPSRASKQTCPQPYLVWIERPTNAEDILPWKCIATFHCLQDATDYLEFCTDGGHAVAFQSPPLSRQVSSMDQRVVAA